MTQKFNLYLGKAGQSAVMSYFLMRGWNVATPEVDVGDDLLVVEDQKGVFYRVQVKTAQATVREGGYSVRFKVPLQQLRFRKDPEMYYIFVVCKKGEWSDKIIISRSALFEIYQDNAIGSLVKGTESLLLYFSFQNDGKIMCSEVDFTIFKDNFDDFPIITH